MSRKIAIAAAAMISMGMMGLSASSASANYYGHQSYAHSCYKTAVKVPAWKRVWRSKRVYTGCGYERVKYSVKIKVWHTKWKTICH